MKITIKPEDTGRENYWNNFNCPIAMGLRRKLILSVVGGESWTGLFLGIIPVWGKIPLKLADAAHDLARYKITSNQTYEIGLYK